MRVAVLGSTSFAGTDFVDLLLTSGSFDVLGISRSNQRSEAFLPASIRSGSRYTYRQCDFNHGAETLIAELEAFDPHYIVNFAAQGDDAASWSYPEDFFQTNCVALAGLLDKLRKRTSVRRFLQVSSSGVYGNPVETITETSALRPESPYAASKAAADLLLLAYHRNAAIPVQIVRPPNLYGPFQQLFRIIPKTIIALRRGESIELHGGGRAVRAYLHVRDASRAMLAILERGQIGEIYNVSPDELYCVRDLVAMICTSVGEDFARCTRDVDERRGQASVTDFDSTKIRSKLGWRPEISIEHGIEGIRDWIAREWSQLMEHRTIYTHTR